MFRDLSKLKYVAFYMALIFTFATGLTACGNSEPPKPMKAVKQFNSEKELKDHLTDIKKNHMDFLIHKRDETLIRGVRTETNSLKACISCHVPEKHNGEILRYSNPEHFCATCHSYVAVQLDCFQCHVDHPVSDSGNTAEAPDDSTHNKQLFGAEEQQVNSQASIVANNTTTNKALTGESASE